jgi:acyl-coenzyme A thioesterase PaaI-like protein
MAVNVNKVYNKVLAISNKEQRGYITPQEFNLMADKAQREIYGNYFHDYKTALMKSKNQTNFADEIEMLERKMDVFKVSSTITVPIDTAEVNIPNAYFVESLRKKDANIKYTKLSREENLYAEANPLTKATTSRPTYVKTGSMGIILYPTPTVETEIDCEYFTQPSPPMWGYVVVKGRPLYNGSSTSTTHFSLHASEEENLVNRILQLCGVIIQKPGLVEIGMQERAAAKQEQND